MRRLRITRQHLPAYCHAGRHLREIRGIVLHYVSAVNVEPRRRFAPAAVHALLLDLNRPASERDFYDFEPTDRLHASYHYVISRHGGVRELVAPPQVAYHAGVSEMHGVEGCNEFCLGISLIATHDSGFTDSQYTALTRLSAELVRRHAIAVDWIQGHEDVARPHGRKPDPGPEFDWDRFRDGLRAEST